jgi:putative transposase
MAKKVDVPDRAATIARILRPLGTRPLTREQAKQAARLLDVHWTTIYRLRRRFLRDPVSSSLKPSDRGPRTGSHRLAPPVEAIIDDVLTVWLSTQRQLAHPLRSLVAEVSRRCKDTGVSPPSRDTIARRWEAHNGAEAMERTNDPGSAIAPGNFVVKHALDVVQIDHTQADLLVVDDLTRRPVGRPWLSLAVDVATRCVVGFFVGIDRPNAATVALLLTRVVLPKTEWLTKLGVTMDWPMQGLPKTLHLDNAAEFKSRALQMGCSEYGFELMYRPVGKPHFGGHIERLNRTLMERVHGLPGSTGSSPKGRKERHPEQQAALTLREFEQWLALEIGQHYHHSPHRGLLGDTPVSRWASLCVVTPPQTLSGLPDAALRFLVHFLPVARRTIQRDGLTLFYARYWHPIFTAWRETGREVIVRYHPEDLSRVFVSAAGHEFIEVRYADLRRPAISLWEQRAAVKYLREQGHRTISDVMMFRAIEEQRCLVERARSKTRSARRRSHLRSGISHAAFVPSGQDGGRTQQAEPVDYSRPVSAYDVEQW